MNIAICDDDEFCRSQISKFLNLYSDQNHNITFTAFSSPDELLKNNDKLDDFDVFLLDIVMPDMNGIELGMKLRKLGITGNIIYLTSSTEFALDSFKVKAFNYILKPVDIQSLFEALDEADRQISVKKEKSIIVKTKEKSVLLPFDSIMYAELSKRSIVYHLANNKTIESVQIRAKFAETMQELLKENNFILCGVSMVVNMYHIFMIENDTLIFKNNSKIYIGKKNCRDIRSIWHDFWSDKENI